MNTMEPATAKLRWFQFRLRAIFGLMAVCAVLLAAARWREHVKNKRVYQALEAEMDAWWNGCTLDSALMNHIAEPLDIEIKLDESIDGTTEIWSKLMGPNARVVLDQTCDSIDATWEIRGGVIYVVPRPKDQDHR